ncbi:unnamed protein product [Hyaloperonospora brassicae]|uniref:Uncharacterized protein n=1 Tax=Hyaloperonospora brassicae TaxID=162125 RepID=A0AAV0V2Z6_HYABA|nr:unnamed protein product [Hyaloperonospora brassicae]
MPNDELADFRARMAQPPKDWVEAALVAVLKDPVFYTAVGLGAFFLLVVLALFATKVLLDDIGAHETQAEQAMERKTDKKEQ